MKQTSNRKFHYAFLVVIVYAIALPAVFLFSNAFGLIWCPSPRSWASPTVRIPLRSRFNEIVSGVLYFFVCAHRAQV